MTEQIQILKRRLECISRYLEVLCQTLDSLRRLFNPSRRKPSVPLNGESRTSLYFFQAFKFHNCKTFVYKCDAVLYITDCLNVTYSYIISPSPSSGSFYNELTKLASSLLAMLAQFMVRVINQLSEVIRVRIPYNPDIF